MVDIAKFQPTKKDKPMKLYVIHPITKEKVYLEYDADDRGELEYKIGRYDFFIDSINYNIDDVHAEGNSIDSITGLASGAAIGSLFIASLGAIIVPIGAIAGVAAGIGFSYLAKPLSKELRARRFNESKSKKATQKL